MIVHFKCTRNGVEVLGKFDTENPNALSFRKKEKYDKKSAEHHELNVMLDSIEGNKPSILENLKRYKDNDNVIINYWTFTLKINEGGVNAK